ncbi:DUF1566 domain-containing protein [uncultured Campylobacter sp.]|uniref:Lcl C-terminal domain-containing protein n=1 Tax=uncultured Campylobacter sp. TaxID=218934 RepID=UPI00262C242E|nr:DUF1566 domain-containing protein [uncultured Campylobacter sp.]
MRRYMVILALFFAFLNADALNATCYRDNDKNVVICGESKLGKLMWQDDERVFIGDWKQAKERCERLNFAAYSDWRLPSIDELISITDKTKFSPAINSAFKYVKSDFYWSSTKFADGSSRAWFVHFKNGYGDWSGISDRLFARCVRND